MKDARRNAFFLYYNSETDYVWLCDVTQEYDASLDDWVDVDEPSMLTGYSYVYADTERAPWGDGGFAKLPQKEAHYVYGEILLEMAKLARAGFVFLGYRSTTEKLD